MSDLFKELPFNPKDSHAEKAQLIIEKMAEARMEADDPRERSQDLDATTLVVLLHVTRHAQPHQLEPYINISAHGTWPVPGLHCARLAGGVG